MVGEVNGTAKLLSFLLDNLTVPPRPPEREWLQLIPPSQQRSKCKYCMMGWSHVALVRMFLLSPFLFSLTLLSPSFFPLISSSFPIAFPLSPIVLRSPPFPSPFLPFHPPPSSLPIPFSLFPPPPRSSSPSFHPPSSHLHRDVLQRAV